MSSKSSLFFPLFFVPLCAASFSFFLFSFRVSICMPHLLTDPSFFLLYCGLFTPAGMKTISFSDLNSFLPRHCGPDLRQETCEFKDLYFWRNYRKSNLLANDTNLVIFGPLRLEIRAINQDSIRSPGSSGLIQSLFFDSFFGLRNSKTELYALHMFCRPSSQIFENGDEHLELSCIASFAAHNTSMFGFTAGVCLLSNLVSENTLISHEVNSSKRDLKF